jgi:hypothetical protein
MLRRRHLALLIAITTSSVASADDYIPLGNYGQIGLGFAYRFDAEDRDRSLFEGTLRVSPAWQVTDQLFAGGFVEVRTPGFDGFEAYIGPQAQLRIGDVWGLQARAGIGAEADGQGCAVAGLQLGNVLLGGTVTARRYFDDDRTELSFNLELSTVWLLVPFFRGSQ